MERAEAVKLALAILKPFAEAGNIYDDYKADEKFTDEQYDAMIAELEKSGPFSVVYEADGDIYNVGPFATEAELDVWLKANGNGEEFDINDQRAYVLHPDHRMVEISISDVEGDDEGGDGDDDDNPDEVEVEGGVMEWESDGTIRYRDNHGNTEGLWRPGEAEYDRYKADYFPDHEANEDDEDDITEETVFNEDKGNVREDEDRTVSITIANRKGKGSHVETVEFENMPALKKYVDGLVEEVPFYKVEVELSASWDVTDDEQAALDAIENGDELPEVEQQRRDEKNGLYGGLEDPAN